MNENQPETPVIPPTGEVAVRKRSAPLGTHANPLTQPVIRDILYRYLERQPIETIAEVYGITVGKIKRILRYPTVTAERDRILGLVTQHMANRVELLVPEALDTVRDTVRGKNLSELRLKAARDVLDHAKSFEKNQGNDAVKDLGAAIIRELNRKIEGKPSVDVVELTPEEESEGTYGYTQDSGRRPQATSGDIRSGKPERAADRLKHATLAGTSVVNDRGQDDLDTGRARFPDSDQVVSERSVAPGRDGVVAGEAATGDPKESPVDDDVVDSVPELVAGDIPRGQVDLSSERERDKIE